MHQQLMLSNIINLGDSKIYDFKLNVYHKVNSISKKLEYRNTEALGDDDLS